MKTFTDLDVIRIYEEHLDDVEQAAVEAYFQSTAKDDKKSNSENLRVGLFRLANVHYMLFVSAGSTIRGPAPPLADSIGIGLTWLAGWAKEYKQFLDEYDINEYIRVYKDFYENAKDYEATMRAVLNDDVVDRLFYVLIGFNRFLNAIQLLESLGDETIVADDRFNYGLLPDFYWASRALGFWRPGWYKYPGTNDFLPGAADRPPFVDHWYPQPF